MVDREKQNAHLWEGSFSGKEQMLGTALALTI